MLRCAIKPPRGYERLIKRDDIVVREDDVEIHYRVIVHHKETVSSDGEIVLKAVSGPGGHGEPVLTIMRTYES
jgi:homospermidine synthase